MSEINRKIIAVPARLTEAEAAEVLGVSQSALRQHRRRNKGLPYRRLATGKIFYELADLETYLVGEKIYTDDFPNPAAKKK